MYVVLAALCPKDTKRAEEEVGKFELTVASSVPLTYNQRLVPSKLRA